MFKKIDKNSLRVRKHASVRKKISGTPERPRLCVFKSSKHIYVQIIDDVNAVTLVAASTVEKAVRAADSSGATVEAAQNIGKLIAEKAKAKGIDCVVFDRGGYLYHGRIAAIAEGAREAGLKF